MNDIILSQNQAKSIDSLEISELVKKRHDSVKRTIEILSEKTDKREAVIARPHSVVVQKEANNRIYEIEVYVFSGEQGKLDSITVVAQLCPEFTAALVKRWYELEEQVHTPALALPDFTDPVAAARAWADEVEAKQLAMKQVAVLEPKAKALDTIAETENTYTIRECAKTIGIKEKDLIDLLLSKKWCYRDEAKKLQPYAEKVSSGVFINRASPVIKNNHDGQERVFLHMRITAFGLTRITGLVNKQRGNAA